MKVLRPGTIAAQDMESRSWAAWARDQYLDHDTYTPTLTNVTNVTSSTASECQYARVGNAVTVSGKVSVTATGAGTAAIGIDLPIASNFAATEDCGGVGCSTTFLPAYIAADATADYAKLSYSAAGAGAVTLHFSFMYWVQ